MTSLSLKELQAMSTVHVWQIVLLFQKALDKCLNESLLKRNNVVI